MTLQIASSHHLLISLAFLLSTTTCLPVSAGDQRVNVGPSTRVKLGDLDLSTDAGRRELLERLRKAANRVCMDYAYLYWSQGYLEAYRSCFESTLAAAVEKVHHEQFSALYAGTSRPPTR
jgi:UrcA family protein